MAEEARDVAAEAARAAARPVLDFNISHGDSSCSVKIDNLPLATEVVRGIGFVAAVGVGTIVWLKIDSIPLTEVARGVGIGAGVALAYFWMKNRGNTEEAIRNALEERPVAGAHAPDPQVEEIRRGSLLVKLRCHTSQSFLQFISDYESQKVKRRLEEELSKVRFTEELSVTIENAEEIEEHKMKLENASQIPNINLSGNPALSSEDFQSAFPRGTDVKFFTLETKRVFEKVQCRGGVATMRVENGLIEMEASVYPGDVLMKIDVWVFREKEAAELHGDKNGRVALPVIMGEYKMDKVGADKMIR